MSFKHVTSVISTQVDPSLIQTVYVDQMVLREYNDTLGFRHALPYYFEVVFKKVSYHTWNMGLI